MLTHQTAQFVPVVLAALFTIPIGMMWFSHAFFAEPWMRLSKVTPQMMKRGPGASAYASSLLSAFVMAYTLSTLMRIMQMQTVAEGCALAGLLWLAFVLLPSITSALFSKKPMALVLINSGYELTKALMMATVLTIYWK